MFDFLDKKPDHPMYSPEEAARQLGDLSKSDPEKTLVELTEWLVSVRGTPGFWLEVRASVLKFLDETAQPFERKVLARYLPEPHLLEGHGKLHWQTVHHFWSQLAEAYRVCRAQYKVSPKGAPDIKDQLALLGAREIRALTHCLKLLLMRYQPLPEATWSGLYQAFSFAEAGGFAAGGVLAYPKEPVQTSVRAEFLKAMMLDAAYTDNMSPAKIELAFRTASRFASSFAFALQPTDQCNFTADLSKPAPPRLASPRDTSAAGTRFFGAGLALPKLEEMIKQNESGLLTEELRLGDEHSAGEKITVLKHLGLYWGPNPPHRARTRLKISGELSIVHSYSTVCRYIISVEFSSMAELAENMEVKVKVPEKAGIGLATEKADEPPEIWMQQDASDAGVGAIVPPKVGKWVAVGSLCAVKPAGGSAWWAAVVRRLHADAQNRIHVGIELLAKKPVAVWLRVLGNRDARVSDWETTSGSFSYDYLHAVMLTDHAKAENRPVLLLEKNRFVPDQIYEMMVGDKSRHVILKQFLEQGEDYDLGSFDWYQPQAKPDA
jgi:hypothetical protein